jgi:hypothetical protein
MDGKSRTYLLSAYPADIQQKIADAGFKAVFQQRSSQVETDVEKLVYWDDLDAMFTEGTWEREGARGAPVVAVWVEVLAEARKVSVSAIQKSLSAYSKEQKEAIRAKIEKDFAAQIAAKQAEREKGSEQSLDDLLQ